MSGLKELLAKVFTTERILGAPHVYEKGQSFLIRATAGDCVVGVKLDGPGLWPGSLVADAMFACYAGATGSLVVTIVELKGGDVGHAIDQIVATAKRLCRGSADPYSCHLQGVRAAVEKGTHHQGRALGIVVGKQGLSQAQQKKAAARRKDGIVIKARTAKRLEVTCADLAGWIGY